MQICVGIDAAKTTHWAVALDERGEVGHNFMETLIFTASALHSEPLGSHRGLPVDWICWDFNAPDAIPGVTGGCRFGCSMAESDLVGPVAYATRVVGGWGRAHKRALRASFGRALSVTGIGECLPHPESRIRLSTRRDAHGMPTPRIESRLGPDAFSSTHVFGTCRMGHDPMRNVVDGWGRSHRWPNLFVADASLFPSSGGGESPGLTIQALALRTADHLLSEARP